MSHIDKPPQTRAGIRRDQAARFAWGELPEAERAKLRRICIALLDLNQMGEVGLAELLYSLGQSGILEKMDNKPAQAGKDGE